MRINDLRREKKRSELTKSEIKEGTSSDEKESNLFVAIIIMIVINALLRTLSGVSLSVD